MASIREKMPFEIRMNMFLIDCAELNTFLCNKCDEFINRIIEKTKDYAFIEKSNSIVSRFKEI